MKVLVAGGGIGGLATAAALGKAGIDCHVFEQAPRLREVGAGVGLWTNALASLEVLGAAGDLRDSLPLRTGGGANARGRTITTFALDALGPEFKDAACYVVLRPALLAALARRVPEERVRVGARVVRVEQTDAVARLHLEDGRIEEGDLVVGADGLHSIVRAEVLRGSPASDEIRYSGQTCFRGVAAMPPPDPNTLREIQGAGQRAAVCPVDARTIYWWAAYNAPAAGMIEPARRKEALLERYRGWPFGLPEAIAATDGDAILQNDLVDRKPIRRYTSGRLALLGDAAHPTTPNLGQGANMAIDDAIALARALRDEPTLAGALARYERERIPRTRLIVERSWRFGQLCRWDSRLGVALRETMMRATPASVLRKMLRWQILESVGDLR
jgi:2-polyprenyl-6-methoxyphenol hydroxylase-like FAD-dependent oxidoreductase